MQSVLMNYSNRTLKRYLDHPNLSTSINHLTRHIDCGCFFGSYPCFIIQQLKKPLVNPQYMSETPMSSHRTTDLQHLTIDHLTKHQQNEAGHLWMSWSHGWRSTGALFGVKREAQRLQGISNLEKIERVFNVFTFHFWFKSSNI